MSSSKNLEFEKTSFLSKSNSAFIEQMYLKFINKDKDLPESWQHYFEGIGEDLSMIAKEINGPSWGIKQKIDIDEIEKSETIHLKEKTEVYYQMYREARQKAKLAKSLALSSYLEARRIKNLYMLEDIDDSDESDLDDLENE